MPNTQDLANRLAGHSHNAQEATSSGGNYEAPAAGPARGRLVGYIEVGEHTQEFKGVASDRDLVRLVFELSGPNHPPKETQDGVKYLQQMTVEILKSYSEKSHYYKAFNRMRDGGKETHFAQLLGKHYLVEVEQYTTKAGKVGAKIPPASIKPPRYVDQVDGKTKTLEAAPQIQDNMLFAWDAAPADMAAMWATLNRPDGTMSWHQDKIIAANNFMGSPIEQALEGAGNVSLPPAKEVPAADESSFNDMDDDIPF